MDHRAPRRRSLGESVHARLRRDIVSGSLPPGARLTEERLSERYGVSRVPVREALRFLEVEGFVVLEPYRGASVAPLTSADATDLFDVRIALETLAARRASERIDDAGARRLTDLLARGQAAVASERLDLLPDLNTALHLEVVRSSGNAHLVALMGQISDKLERVYASGLLVRARASWQEHEGVVAAVLSGDPDLAEQTMRRHIRTAESAFVAHRAPDAGRRGEPVTR